MSADLTTTYLGLTLYGPLIPSSSPLTGSLASLRMLAELGAGAVVLPSLFEEELTSDNGPGAEAFWSTDDRPGAAASYMETVDRGHLDAYLDLVRDASRELEIPVIASVNSSTPGGWTRAAEALQRAGASAVELNVYAVETDPYSSGAAVEERTLRLVDGVPPALATRGTAPPPRPRRAPRRDDPHRGQALPVLHRSRERRPAADRRADGRARPVQPLRPAGRRRDSARRVSRRRAVAERGAADRPALGGDAHPPGGRAAAS